mmetsp:Transcript_24068/g.45426  ORF Transcript_24068/g.45426 Transcript_24068/m.45426 type:complete len:117 (+) Transcript_24068:68-418(+)
MQVSAVLKLLACFFVAASAQNLKGSLDVSVSADDVLPKDNSAAAQEELHHAEPVMLALHPPTTKQAIVAFGLIFVLPIIALIIMKSGKENGWEGAFGTICCLITCLWVYTAVNAFM